MTLLVSGEGPSTGHNILPLDKLHLMCPWLSTQPSLCLPFRTCKRPKSARQIAGIEAYHSSLAQRYRLVGPRFDLLNYNLQIRFVSLVFTVLLRLSKNSEHPNIWSAITRLRIYRLK